jgi:serine protease AprX
MSSHLALRRALLAALPLISTAVAGLALPPDHPVGPPVALPVSGTAIHAPAATAGFIVRLAEPFPADGGAPRVTAGIEAAGGRVRSLQPALGMLVADLPAGARDRVGRLPGVRTVSPDRSARPLSLGFEPADQPGALTNVTRTTGAQSLWRAGLTGAGVDVALIDTGVAPVPALSDPDKVVVGPDLSFDSQDPTRRYLDGFGHGTHMASIIAGRQAPAASGAAYAADAAHFYGMAPDARLVSVKVGAQDGAVDVSQLIAAIDWVVQNRHRDGLDVKVLNLSFGTDSTQPWLLDPLAQAAEVAARAGILVVAAGGNDGDNARGLADPAYSPQLLAVGAVDGRGTDSYEDDQVPAFSQHSDAALRSRAPDLVAPGVGLVAAAVSGSTLATEHPNALVGTGYIRGSGTSQAAAVVSGAAALLWQKWPGLSVPQLRELLVASSTPLARNRAFEGNGELNLVAALSRQPAPSARSAATLLGLPEVPALGLGSLQGARGSTTLTMDGVPLRGERDIFGHSWSARLLAPMTAVERAWTEQSGIFNGNVWIGPGFSADTTSVAGQTWNGRTWAGRTWAAQTWTGKTWTGRTWAGQNWTGQVWSGPIWAGYDWG